MADQYQQPYAQQDQYQQPYAQQDQYQQPYVQQDQYQQPYAQQDQYLNHPYHQPYAQQDQQPYAQQDQYQQSYAQQDQYQQHYVQQDQYQQPYAQQDQYQQPYAQQDQYLNHPYQQPYAQQDQYQQPYAQQDQYQQPYAQQDQYLNHPYQEPYQQQQSSIEAMPDFIDQSIIEQAEDAEMEQVFIHETPELLKTSLQEFQKISPEFPDAMCMQFLRHSKFDVKKALKVCEESEAFRVQRGLDRQIRFAEVQDLYRTGLYLIGGRDLHGRRIIYVRPRLISPEKANETIKLIWCLLQGLLREEITQQRGVIIMINGKDASPKNFSRELMSNIIKTYQGALPIRVGCILVCNQPGVFKSIWGIISLLMRDKLRKRVKILGSDIAKIRHFIPESQIPTELGGTADISSAAEIEKFCAARLALDQIPIR